MLKFNAEPELLTGNPFFVSKQRLLHIINAIPLFLSSEFWQIPPRFFPTVSFDKGHSFRANKNFSRSGDTSKEINIKKRSNIPSVVRERKRRLTAQQRLLLPLPLVDKI